MKLKILNNQHSSYVPCFCADLTAMDLIENIAFELSRFLNFESIHGVSAPGSLAMLGIRSITLYRETRNRCPYVPLSC